MIEETEFAVVDVETTGLFPKGHDRIIEIAIIRTDFRGQVLSEYVSLVNPERDVGPTNIHGIISREVQNAPTFGEIGGDVRSMLAGAILVAHNASFDLRFVLSEFDRIGCQITDLPHLCTMQFARKIDPAIPSRKLRDLCVHFGVAHEGAHTAYGDAKAAGSLLRIFIASIDEPRGVASLVKGDLSAKDQWPPLLSSGKSYRRKDAVRDLASEISYIGRLISKLPASRDNTPTVDDYLSLLDRALEDRRVTIKEANELLILADQSGLSREQAIDAHRSYMRALIQVALEDGIITSTEDRDLREVKRLLLVSDADFSTMVDEERIAYERGTMSNASRCFRRT